MLDKGDIVRRKDVKKAPELWEVTGDFTEVDTLNDYELICVGNSGKWDCFPERKVAELLNSGEWQKVKL